jgi:hypothetical protein
LDVDRCEGSPPPIHAQCALGALREDFPQGWIISIAVDVVYAYMSEIHPH